MNDTSGVSRRSFLRATAGAAAATGLAAAAQPAATEAAAAAEPTAPAGPRAADGVDLHWLDGAPPPAPVGATWGVPWAPGEVTRHTAFAMSTPTGAPVPVQTWPLAYWPDGSVKWTGHAVGTDHGGATAFHLRPGTPAGPDHPVTVTEHRDSVTVDTGLLTASIPRHGGALISTLTRSGRVTARNATLVLTTQDGPDEPGVARARHSYHATVEHLTIEQRGPVRAVIRLSGRHTGGGSHPRRWLPFTVRLAFTAGSDGVRVVHSFVFDGDQYADFITGLGLRVDVPMTDALHDRHVRFAGDADGLWAEPVRVLSGLRRDAGTAVLSAQFNGTACPPVAEWPAQVSAGYQQLASWNDYKLVQLTADSFTIAKRTGQAGSWVPAAATGRRAAGLGYAGGVSGGLVFGLRDFWQMHPRQLDVRGAATDSAQVTLWTWSPESPAMDLRPYDTTAHGLDLSYEDVQPGFSTPEGIARGCEFFLWAVPATPARAAFTGYAAAVRQPPAVVAEPAYYHAAKVFGGFWSLPDRSTPARAQLEDLVTANLDFYLGQVEERRWYGFWDYGDFRHTYDNTRHEWRYDVGGYAWDNGELGIDLFTWYAFLRSGRPDVFRLGQALTRHLSEVDFHHAGRFAGLGSRHNVVHWGDGAKEARVSAAMLKRAYHYLTADELTGDWMHAALQVDDTLRRIDPLREILPPTTYPARVRVGPDWTALAGNWLVEWERTGDKRWRDRILTGMRDVGAMPYGLFSGFAGAMGFDPTTAHLYYDGREFQDSMNLSMLFGGAELLFELADLLDVPVSAPDWDRQFLLFSRLCNGTDAERQAAYGRSFNPGTFKYCYARLMAYAGVRLGDASLRRRAWTDFQADRTGIWPPSHPAGGSDVLTPVDEITGLGTNDVGQRGLAIIEMLALAPDEAP